MSDPNKCPNCGADRRDGAKFCASCGHTFAEAPPPAPGPGQSEVPSISVGRKRMGRKARMAYAGITIVLVVLFLSIFYSHLPGQPHPVIEKQPEVAMSVAYAGDPLEQEMIRASVQNGDIVVPLPVVLDKKIVAFDYEFGNTTIPLLAYVNTQGKLVTAIRLCEPCNSKKFRIEGNELSCGNCETRWKLDNLEGLQGACQQHPPDPIPSTVNGQEIHISEAAVRNWKIRM